jgi:phenylalanyl-tRNA synthetase beta chain
LLEVLARNLRHGADSVRLFELGPVFRQGEAGQKTALALLSTGAGSDLYDVKGVLCAVLGAVDFTPADGALLEIAGRGIKGGVRRLPRTLAEAHDAIGAVYFAEVLLDRWLETPANAVRVLPLPKFPAVERDLSILLPRATPYAAIEKTLLGAKAPHLQSVGLKDVFVDATGVKLAADQRSVTVTLTFREEGRTLTSEEVDRVVETLRDHAKAELGAVFRA